MAKNRRLNNFGFRQCMPGKGEYYWERIIGPVHKIDYYVRNLCDEPVTIDGMDCRSQFDGLMN